MPVPSHKHALSHGAKERIGIWLLGLKQGLQLLTIVLRYLWLLFPAFLFLLAAYFCFWALLQGKDLLISGLESQWRGSVLLIAVVFWVLTTWYSSRILVYKKDDLFHCGKNFFATDIPDKGFNLNWILYKGSEVLGFHLPRLMGYACFAVVILAYAQLPVWQRPLGSGAAGWLLAGSILLYIFIAALFDRLGIWLVKKGGPRLLRIVYWSSLGVFVLLILKPLFTSFSGSQYVANATAIMVALILIQHLYLFVVVNRRHLMTEEQNLSLQDKRISRPLARFIRNAIDGVLRFANIPSSELFFFFVFNVISLLAIAIYLTGVFNMQSAINIGSLNFAILAFGILVGFFELISIFAIHTRINLHVILLLLVIVFGYYRETHYVRLVKKEAANEQKVRPDLATYFTNWTKQRHDSIEKATTYPLFFILADGGASRSGYWVASVLGKLHDTTAGRFDDHLFALSGASGGSVGNGAYFTLLYYQDSLKSKSFRQQGQDFLQHDFLSYTLARMLGPDFFRPLLPFDPRSMYDRAGALESVMERGTGDTTFLNGKFALPFSTFIPDTAHIRLPIICINVTRMQDGRPGVVSNIEIGDSSQTFGKRIDVLSLLRHDTDMRLSTAVVLGARFPYVSPAGRIDHQGHPDSVSYFVDGGYFDNSGAGVVHEMIMGLQQLITKKIAEDAANGYLKKLTFHVIHITNSPESSPKLRKVHLLQNDLMAPVSALAGSYGTQTDVNNTRLEKYLQFVYGDTTHYQKAGLYYGIPRDSLSFPMNWTISNFYRNKMNVQLNNLQVASLIASVQQKMNGVVTDTAYRQAALPKK